MAEHAERNMESSHPPIFLHFINLLINDAIFLLDEALTVRFFSSEYILCIFPICIMNLTLLSLFCAVHEQVEGDSAGSGQRCLELNVLGTATAAGREFPPHGFTCQVPQRHEQRDYQHSAVAHNRD